MSWTNGINTLCINYKEPRAQFLIFSISATKS